LKSERFATQRHRNSLSRDPRKDIIAVQSSTKGAVQPPHSAVDCTGAKAMVAMLFLPRAKRCFTSFLWLSPTRFNPCSISQTCPGICSALSPHSSPREPTVVSSSELSASWATSKTRKGLRTYANQNFLRGLTRPADIHTLGSPWCRDYGAEVGVGFCR